MINETDKPILVGRKPKESGSFLGPWILVDYWPYVVNGKVIDWDNATKTAFNIGCKLPQEKIYGVRF